MVSMAFVDHFCSGNSPQSFLLNLSMAFMALDIYVDSNIPTLEGKSFAEKIRELNNLSGDLNRILSNIFRIFKLMRNAITHNASSIALNQQTIEIDYQFRGTQYILKGNKKILDYLSTIVFMYINDFTTTYREEVCIKSFYSELLKELHKFNDDFGGQLESLSSLGDQFVFEKLTRRYKINLTTDYYCIEGNQVCFSNNYYRVHEQEQAYYGADFLIGFARAQYLIPYEVIENNAISLSNIQKWKI